MSWTECAPYGRERWTHAYRDPVVHAGQIVWLWHHERSSVIYDPGKDRWSALADPFNSTSHVRSGAAIVSTGDELLVWGGAVMTDYASRNARPANDGVRRGSDDTWKPMATERAPSARAGSMNAWTGRELVVWGGGKNGKPISTGGAYDPATDTWRKFGKTNVPALPMRGELTNVHRNCVWSGRELWMWSYTDGHAFDPVANTWRDIASVPGPVETTAHDQAFVALADGALLVRQNGPWAAEENICSAWRYDAERDRWRGCKNTPSIKHARPSIVACGERIIVGLGERIFDYNAARDVWTELPLPELGDSPHLVWVADRLFACAPKTGAVKSLKL